MASKPSSFKRAFSTTLHQIRQYTAPTDRSIPAAKQKYVPTTGTYPKGFLAGTSHAGVKASNTKYDDIALVVSEQPCAASAVFTRNIFKAAPVTASKQALIDRRNDGFRGVVVNSGCANAVTGKLGVEHAALMGRETDKCFGEVQTGTAGILPGILEDPPPQTLVMSTGVIGQRLPIAKITAAIPKAHQALGSSHEHWLNAAQAICTTDTFPKLLSRTFTLPSHPETTYRIAGMTKGAGMIHPNMATLLGIICTDAKIAPEAMTPLLRYAADRTFNCISIDGDTSTNDTVAFLANGAAAPSPDTPAITTPPPVNYRRDHPAAARRHTTNRTPQPQQQEEAPAAPLTLDAAAFRSTLTSFMQDLAQLVVRDGEGATKFVTIRVTSDISYTVAKRAAVSIARSALVKTALYGKDANWGRILCAIGYAPGIMRRAELHAVPTVDRRAQVVPERTSVSFLPADGSGRLDLLVRGEPEAVDEGRAREILEMEDLEILVRLDDGPAAPAGMGVGGGEEEGGKQYEAVFWTCDFSHEYVTINGDYRT